MSLVVKVTSSSAPIPPGIYDATVENIERREGQNGEFFLWRFLVTYKGKPYSVSRPTSSVVSDGSTDLHDLIGKPCRVAISVQNGKDGATRNSVEMVYAAHDEDDENEF